MYKGHGSSSLLVFQPHRDGTVPPYQLRRLLRTDYPYGEES